MIVENFYTGEPVNAGSPYLTQENEAANAASFGMYNYNQNNIYPGNYNYNNGYNYQQQYPQYNNGYGQQMGYYPQYNNGYNYQQQYPQYGYQQNQCGIGYMPQYNNGYYGQQQMYNNVQPSYNQFKQPVSYVSNPVFQMVETPKVIHIPGISLGSEYLPTPDIQERIYKLESEYSEKLNNVDSGINNNCYNYGYNNGFNYYGANYYNSNQYYAINNELVRSIESMKDEMRENRTLFNIKLSRLAHRTAKDGVTDEQIEEMYRGKDIPVPQGLIIDPQEAYEMERLASAVPFDNSWYYREQWNKVSEEFNSILPEKVTMENAFDNIGILYAKWEMEEEMHRRRNLSTTYKAGDGGYRYFLKKKVRERNLREKGILPNTMIESLDVNNINSLLNYDPMQARREYIANSPLREIATLSDDGTLNVSFKLPCNVGSDKGQIYEVNENEAGYEQKRERFSRGIHSIDKAFELEPLIQKQVDSFNG